MKHSRITMIKTASAMSTSAGMASGARSAVSYLYVRGTAFAVSFYCAVFRMICGTASSLRLYRLHRKTEYCTGLMVIAA
jgi:hypothetical protein